MVDNPDYKGGWAPRKIENPHYFEDLQVRPHRRCLHCRRQRG